MDISLLDPMMLKFFREKLKLSDQEIASYSGEELFKLYLQDALGIVGYGDILYRMALSCENYVNSTKT